MKIIDRTPFFNEKGEISFADRTRATLKYGRTWIAEMEAQKSILPVMEKYLDRKYTLVRNVILPGLEEAIPIILVGPAGIFVIYVTDISGMFRAKGDLWGTVTGNAFKPERINLLTRTEQLARVVQLFLQRQGRLDIPGVETALIFTNPSIHVDSIRPIVRVVLCDALERYFKSLSEAAQVLGQDMVIRIIERITNPNLQKYSGEVPAVGEPMDSVLDSPLIPAPTILPPTAPLSGSADTNTDSQLDVQQSPDIFVTDIVRPVESADMENIINPEYPPIEPTNITASLQPHALPPVDLGDTSPTPVPTIASTTWPAPAPLSVDLDSHPGMIPLQSELTPEPDASPLPESLFPRLANKPLEPEQQAVEPIKAVSRKPFNRKQWIILAGLVLFWIILIAILLFFVLKDFIL